MDKLRGYRCALWIGQSLAASGGLEPSGAGPLVVSVCES
jgi:hypothetical protein